MNPQDIPLQGLWWSCELNGYRPNPDESTYVAEEYASLPPLPKRLLGKDFEWLKSQPMPPNHLSDPRLIGPKLEWWLQNYDAWKSAAAEKIGQFKSIAKSNRLAIPREFCRFLGNADLVCRIRAAADGYFQFPNSVLPWPFDESWSLIHFFSDSQDCFWWYLLVSEKDDHCVVTSTDIYTDARRKDETKIENWWFCEKSFESFVIRLWIENEIWFKLSFENERLDAIQQEYVNHYRK